MDIIYLWRHSTAALDHQRLYDSVCRPGNIHLREPRAWHQPPHVLDLGCRDAAGVLRIRDLWDCGRRLFLLGSARLPYFRISAGGRRTRNDIRHVVQRARPRVSQSDVQRVGFVGNFRALSVHVLWRQSWHGAPMLVTLGLASASPPLATVGAAVSIGVAVCVIAALARYTAVPSLITARKAAH